MAKVENVQETVEEPTPNPYNAKKSWHTEDVMPKEGLTADSLFVAPKPEKEKGDQQIEEQTATQDKPYSQPNYKKRYDDLKKHYDTKLNEFRTREQELANKVQQAQPVYEAPKSLEELERFKAEYPDVYEVVESVAHLKSEDKIKGLTDKVALIEAREQDIMRREAEKDLMEKHPDYSDLRNNDDFHNWAEEQPQWVQNALYENEDDAKSAARAIDLYKSDRGMGKKDTSKSSKNAAKAVSTKNKTSVPDANNQNSVIKESDVQRMSADEYEKNSDMIMEAIRSGNFLYDVSGSAR